MPAIVDLKYAWKLSEAHTITHSVGCKPLG